MRAMWKGAVIAESDVFVPFQGTIYFPRSALSPKFVKPSASQTMKEHGMARFFDVVVDAETNKDAAWWYPDPAPEAAIVKDMVAFWKGIKTE